MKSYYDILGVSAQATQEELQAAHRLKSQETVMDTDAFEEVQEAYQSLQNPDHRVAYDRRLADAADMTQSVPRADLGRKGGTVPLRRPSPSAEPAVGDVPPSPSAEDLRGSHQRAVQCPICGQQNVPTEVYCVECGFLLGGVAAGAEASAAESNGTHPRLEDRDGRLYPLRPGLNRVGRESADILLRDKTVSRYHAMVVYDEERQIFSVEDAGSSNGTRVNQTPLPPRTSHSLTPGDTVEFGTFSLRLLPPETEDTDRTMIGGVMPSKRETTLPPVALQPPVGRLRLLRGRGPQEVALRPGLNSVGRLPDNTVSLANDRYVSGHHAQIVVEAGIFRLIDVGSTNGTYLNGLRLTTNESIAVSDGDEIMIGSNIFQFQKMLGGEHGQEPSSVPLSGEMLPPLQEMPLHPEPPRDGEAAGQPEVEGV